MDTDTIRRFICTNCGATNVGKQTSCLICNASAPEASVVGGTDFVESSRGSSVCSRCGSQNREDALFCARCGESLTSSVMTPPPVLICSKCGAPLKENARFCSKCGSAV